MYTLSSNHKEFDRQKWIDFLNHHPQSTIFQSPEIVDLYNTSLKGEPLVIACFNEFEEFVGILVAEIQREYKGILGNLTARAIVMGGPLVKNENLTVALLLIKEFDRVCKKKVVYSQFRNLWKIENYSKTFINQKYIYEDHLNIIVDLNRSEELLWKDVHSKRKNEIRKAIKESVTFQEIISIEEFDQSYNILQDVYKRAKLPLPNRYYFLNAWNILSPIDGLKAFGAFFNNELIGVMIVLCYNNRIYDWYAGSYQAFYGKNPNDLIPWEVFKWGSIKHYTIFDFGGAGKPDKPYGVRDYKKKFGGDLVNYGRYEKIQKPLLMKIARFGFKIWKMLNFL